jgi:hypothetical protein
MSSRPNHVIAPILRQNNFPHQEAYARALHLDARQNYRGVFLMIAPKQMAVQEFKIVVGTRQFPPPVYRVLSHDITFSSFMMGLTESSAAATLARRDSMIAGRP